MPAPIVLLTTGTRGDVQPFIALGLALQSAGVPASLASDPQFAGLAAAYGLPFLPVEGNPSALMIQSGRQALTLEGSLAGSLRASLQYLRAARPCYAQMLENAWRACRGARALVVGLPSLWGAHIAEALAIPCIYGLQQPLTRTAAYPSVLLPPGLLPGWGPLNRLSHLLVEQAVWQPWRGVIDAWRRRSLGLPAAPWSGIAGRMYERDTLVLNAFSPRVVPPSPDAATNQHATGFWFLDPPPGWQPPADLLAFLEAGPPPVYIGFGSPGPREQQAAAQLIFAALRDSGLRAVAALPAEAFPAQSGDLPIFPLGDAPHAWLFPRCAALVHHGGSGTTAAGLRAGRPALVLPRATDQFFWGSRVQALGCGPAPLPQRSLSAPALAHRLQELVCGQGFAARARQSGEVLQLEGGVTEAARLILQKLS